MSCENILSGAEAKYSESYEAGCGGLNVSSI